MDDFIKYDGHPLNSLYEPYPDNKTLSGNGSYNSPLGFIPTNRRIETVLFSSNSGVSSCNLSQPYSSFDYIKIGCITPDKTFDDTDYIKWFNLYKHDLSSNNIRILSFTDNGTLNGVSGYNRWLQYKITTGSNNLLNVAGSTVQLSPLSSNAWWTYINPDAWMKNVIAQVNGIKYI